MSRDQNKQANAPREYTVTAKGPVNIAGRLKVKGGSITLLPSVAVDYSHCLKVAPAPKKSKS